MRLVDPYEAKFEASLTDSLKVLINRKLESYNRGDKNKILNSLEFEYRELKNANSRIHRANNINIVFFTFLIPIVVGYVHNNDLLNKWINLILTLMSAPSFLYGMALMVDRSRLNESTRLNQLKLQAYSELISELKELTESEKKLRNQELKGYA